jgi:hypothetical protein
MADENNVNSLETISAISFEDIAEFIKERVRNHLCPCCSTNDWTVVGDADHLLGIVGAPKTGGFEIPPPIIPVVGLECKNCGYVRVHTLARIALWKQEKKR